MPTYEYECPKCGTHFEEFQKMSARPVATCPRCGAKAKRLMSAGAGLVFKGSGFYLTDYGRAGQKPRPGEGSESASSESKSDSKTEPKGEAKPGSESKPDAKPAKPGKKKAD